MTKIVTSFVLGAALLAAACAHVPLHFEGSVDDHWTLPIVDPLADAQLVVPCLIDGKGPYLFLINPGARSSEIDEGVAEDLALYSRNIYHRVVTQKDHTVPVRVFEVRQLDAGTLRMRALYLTGVKHGSLLYRGEPIAGILGSNPLSDSLLVDIDRDRGLVTLSVAGGAVQGVGTRVEGRRYLGQLIVPARLDGRAYQLGVDLAAKKTALWDMVQGGLQRLPSPTLEQVIDEYGTTDEVHVKAFARAVLLDGGPAINDVRVADYHDLRWRPEDVDGVLGENVLARYRATIDFDGSRVWLAPRDADFGVHLDERVHRWGEPFAACAVSGCAATSLESGALTITRDPSVQLPRYQVVVQGLGSDGRPFGAPLLRVVLDGPAATVKPSPAFARAASFRVVDVAPHAPACAGGGCPTELTDPAL